MTLSESSPVRAPGRVCEDIPGTTSEVGPFSFRPRNELRPACTGLAAGNAPEHDVLLVRSGGWISLPDWPPLAQFHPDWLGPPPLTTFISGFRNVTGLPPEQRSAQPGKAQYPAPVLWVDQYDGGNELEVAVGGLEPGAHPAASSRILVYTFRPSSPGTYLYRLGQEDAGRVHPGTTGVVLVRPRQNGNRALYPSGKYVHNDGDGSSGYDREFVMLLSEVWAEAQWSEAHGRSVNWASYRADFALLNGRTWPDTLVPGGSVDPFHPTVDPGGDPIAPAGNHRLRYQPCSSLVTCNAGERVLLRFANLGLRDVTMRLEGPRLRVVGKDAILALRDRGSDARRGAHNVSIGPGELVDGIFTAPPHSGRAGPDRYALRNPFPPVADPGGRASGQRTEVRVYPAAGPGALPPQRVPNT